MKRFPKVILATALVFSVIGAHASNIKVDPNKIIDCCVSGKAEKISVVACTQKKGTTDMKQCTGAVASTPAAGQQVSKVGEAMIKCDIYSNNTIKCAN
ncbi:MAG: hypothetical protein Q8M20_11965 [Rhodocyclaceae bacterium]|nr:hypothetical protein [Rhodocyclaceae bacterium]MDZ4214629.1 hypothetical protein [Rhodocyclaceae bacterium]